MKSDRELKQKYSNAIGCIKDVQDIYRPHRKYKRKDAGPEDEQTRVRITLLEYGNKGNKVLPIHLKSDMKSTKTTTDTASNKTTDDSLIDTQRNELVCYNEFSLLLLTHQLIYIMFVKLYCAISMLFHSFMLNSMKFIFISCEHSFCIYALLCRLMLTSF